MRFVAGLKAYTNADHQLQFQFPCAGVLKNVSFTMFAPNTEVVDQDSWRLVLGNANRVNLADQTPLVDGSFAQVQSARSKDLIAIQGLDFQEARIAHTGGSTNVYYYFYHSSKTLRIRNDVIYTLGIFGKPASTHFWVFVQGEFYPYENSYAKFSYYFDALDDGSDYSEEIVIPTNLRNVVIEYEAYVKDTEGTEIAARVIPRILRRDAHPVSIATVASGGGVLDGSITSTGDIRYGNTTDGFIVGTAASGLASSQGVIPIRDNIRAGDRITFDVMNIEGDITNAETFKLTFVVHGRTIGEKTRVKSHFLDSNWFIQPLKEVFE